MLDLLRDLLHLIRDPGDLIRIYGLWGLTLIVFLETGAFCFFLPGDSLIVTAGFYAAGGKLSLAWLILLLIPASFLGNTTSYWLGARIGPRLFNKPRSRFFKPEHVRSAHAFYEKHGGSAIVIARFMPIVRTFVPVVAGLGGMPYGRYAFYNLVGGAAWVLSMSLTGYFLGSAFPTLVEHIELVIVAVVVLSLAPGLIAWLRARRAARATAAAPPE